MITKYIFIFKRIYFQRACARDKWGFLLYHNIELPWLTHIYLNSLQNSFLQTSTEQPQFIFQSAAFHRMIFLKELSNLTSFNLQSSTTYIARSGPHFSHSIQNHSAREFLLFNFIPEKAAQSPASSGWYAIINYWSLTVISLLSTTVPGIS